MPTNTSNAKTLIHRCKACNGKKQLLGLGSIYKDCQACKGIGYFSSEIEQPISEPSQRDTIIDLTKKRGRKPGQRDKIITKVITYDSSPN